MDDLVDFSRRVKERLTTASGEPHWGPGEAERYMAEVSVRRDRFDQLATRLNDTIIQPRLETLGSYFPNAALRKNEPPGRCSCMFGYLERFPASVKVAFAVEHDVRFEKVTISYEASMMPLFIKLNEHDKLILPLDQVKDEVVADWVADRLLDFLEAYLRIDRGGDDFTDEPAIDPVCGMRISRSTAAASDSYLGHPYFFCSADCRATFALKPTAYVDVKTL